VFTGQHLGGRYLAGQYPEGSPVAEPTIKPATDGSGRMTIRAADLFASFPIAALRGV
jgi:hypothetical protein